MSAPPKNSSQFLAPIVGCPVCFRSMTRSSVVTPSSFAAVANDASTPGSLPWMMTISGPQLANQPIHDRLGEFSAFPVAGAGHYDTHVEILAKHRLAVEIVAVSKQKETARAEAARCHPPRDETSKVLFAWPQNAVPSRVFHALDSLV